MQKITVSGGVPLHGEVAISGAKNAVLPILCATLLADAPVEILNVPHLHDVVTTIKLLGELGATVEFDQGTLARGSSLVVDPRSVNQRSGASVRWRSGWNSCSRWTCAGRR